MNVLIAGFSYVRKNYFDTFEFYPQKGRAFFLLPKTWKAKGGKVVFNSPEAENVFTTRAFFYHSRYPLIGGLLKGWMPSFPFVLLRLKKKIDIVYSPSEPILLTTLYQGVWTRIFGLKHIIFTWENIPYENKFKGINRVIKRIILKLNLFFCDGIVCGNKKAKEILSNVTKKPLAVIPLSGVNVDFFDPSRSNIDTSKYQYLNNKLVFAFAGAIGFRKGIHLIIKALKDVIKELPNAHFVLIGSGGYEEEINSLIKKLGLDNRITKIPWADYQKLKKLFSVSDIFLYPSFSYGGWEEQFGYSMAEASLMQLPVISTRSGSIQEVVIDNKTGILVKPNSEIELKAAMIKLGKDEDLRERLGMAGRDYISSNFSYEVVAKKFYDFFEKISAIH